MRQALRGYSKGRNGKSHSLTGKSRFFTAKDTLSKICRKEIWLGKATMRPPRSFAIAPSVSGTQQPNYIGGVIRRGRQALLPLPTFRPPSSPMPGTKSFAPGFRSAFSPGTQVNNYNFGR